MEKLFTFFLQITVILVGIITSTRGQAMKLSPFNSLKYKLIYSTKVDAIVKSIWLPTGSNYLIFSGNSPGLKG
jgi:hypothetical protein